MPYSTANRPFLTVAAVAGGFGVGSSDAGGNRWMYRSSDAIATVIATGYFTEGGPNKLNMRPGDIVDFVRVSTAVPAIPQALHTLCISSFSTNGASATILGTSS
jgi:hypothetical protein